MASRIFSYAPTNEKFLSLKETMPTMELCCSTSTKEQVKHFLAKETFSSEKPALG